MVEEGMVSLEISRAGRCKWCLAAGANRVHISQDSMNVDSMERIERTEGYRWGEIQAKLTAKSWSECDLRVE